MCCFLNTYFCTTFFLSLSYSALLLISIKTMNNVISANGHDFKGQRYLPVLLKDVAGLVPGAWEGKGRGNR